MELNLDGTLNKLMDHIKTMAKTETVVGDAIQIGEFTCVPVIKIGVGIGGGSGETKGVKKFDGGGGGAGAGFGVTPIGFLVSRGEEVSFLSTDKHKGIQTIFEKVPDLLDKLMDMRKNKKEEKESSSAEAKKDK